MFLDHHFLLRFFKILLLIFLSFFFFKHRKIFLTLIIFGTQQSYLLHQFLISFTFICQFFVPVNSRFVCKQTLNNLNCESDIPVFFFFNFYFTDWKVVGRHFSQLWIKNENSETCIILLEGTLVFPLDLSKKLANRNA